MNWKPEQANAYQLQQALKVEALRAAKAGVTITAATRETGSEADLHDKVFEECRRRRWVAFHGSMATRTHRTAGEPDFVILADGGRTFLVECKTAIGKLSTVQLGMQMQSAQLGHTFHVVRSFAEFLQVIDAGRLDTNGAHGVTRPT